MTRSRIPLVFLALVASCGGGAAVSGGAPGSAAVAPPPGAVAAATIRYRPTAPWRALYTRADTFITRLPNGGEQRQSVELRLQLRWSVVAVGSGLELNVVIDSVRVIGAPGTAGRSAEDSARGTVVRGRLTADGQLDSVVASREGAVTYALVADLRWLVPHIQGDTAWSDTTTATVRFGVVDIQEKTARRSTAAPLPDGAIISMVGAVGREGVTPQLKLTGTGNRYGTASITREGRVRSAGGRDSVLMSAAVEAMGQSVQILQLGAYTLTPLP